MSFSDYAERIINDWSILGTAASTGSRYIALFTASPTDANSGTEVTGGSYARVQITTQFSASSGTTGTNTNTGVITFPAATANWGTVTHFGIYDASTAGNLIRWGAISPNVAINSGTTASFAVGQLSFTVD